jgi:hypothetical protein
MARMETRRMGRARRVVVHLPFGARRRAWDCRPFGFGRVIAPKTDGEVAIAPDTVLDLSCGELRRLQNGHLAA